MYIYPKSGGCYEVYEIPGQFPDGLAPGWYWWVCWPGCLPDGDAVGPFATEQMAIDNLNLVDA